MLPSVLVEAKEKALTDNRKTTWRLPTLLEQALRTSNHIMRQLWQYFQQSQHISQSRYLVVANDKKDSGVFVPSCID